MDAVPPNRSRRWWRVVLVPLLGFGLMGLVGIFAVVFLRPTRNSDDSKLIDKTLFNGGKLSLAELRAQVGDEQIVRSIRSCLRERLSDQELGLRDWLDANRGKQPRWLQNGIGKTLPAVEVDWRQREMRVLAALALFNADLKEAPSALPELISMTESSHFVYASWGTHALGALREGAAPALPGLFHQLERKNDLGPMIVEAISLIDPQGKRSTPQFVALLQTTTDQNRAAILPILGRHARSQPELATNHWPLLFHTNREVVLAAVYGLAIGEQLTPLRLESYRAGFHANDARVRRLSLDLVASAGANAGGFISELREVALHKSSDQARALDGLRAVLSTHRPVEQRLAAVEAILASDHGSSAWDVLAQLDQLGADPSRLLSFITQALAHPNERVRAKAVEMLGNLGPAARNALPQLHARQHDEWKMVRDAVELALLKIGE